MDTSETYIKMRLAAIPDLGLGTPILSVMFVVTEDVFIDNKGDFYIKADRAPYWCQLERQDQLQEMLGYSTNSLIHEFYDWVTTAPMIHESMADQMRLSLEQLWLAFVMKEKFGKTWDGERWIDGKD